MPTVLVADDNSNIQKAVVTALREHGIEVLTVGNGEAAVRKLTDSRPDLILADIFMPVRNGYEVCEYVKKDDRFAHIPVVLLVGAFDPLDEHEVERVHADGVLKKPFVPPDPLIHLVKSFLERLTAGGAPVGAAAVEDTNGTQDVVPGLVGRTPTGTVQLPGPQTPVVERTQLLEPAAAAAPEKTQRLVPEAASAPPASLEHFELGLAEPKPAPQMEKTQQLSAEDISKLVQRPSPLAAPPQREEEIEDYGSRPAAVELGSGESPVAFEDLLQTPEAGTEEHPESVETGAAFGEGKLLGFEAFAAAEGQAAEPEEPAQVEAEEPSAAEVHFGGIREETKTPDPERPPIPVVFEHSEPAEFITEEHVESSGMEIGPAENLVSSSSGWASSEEHGVTHPATGPEPELLPEGPGAEGFMSAPLPGPPARPEPVAPAIQDFAISPAGGPGGPEEFEDTKKLDAHILREEVNRAQEIAARIAAQNREALAQEALAGAGLAAAASGPGIDRAISVVDEMLARHKAPGAEASTEPPARVGTGTQQIAAEEVAGLAAPQAEPEAPPAAAAARVGTGTEQIPVSDIVGAGRVGTGTEQIPVAELAAAAAPVVEAAAQAIRTGTGTEQLPVPEFGGIAGAAVAATTPAAPAAPESRPTGTIPMSVEEIAAQARAAAASPQMIEAVSERVLAQLDPYLIEKISKEIVRPIIEAILKRELEKLQ